MCEKLWKLLGKPIYDWKPTPVPPLLRTAETGTRSDPQIQDIEKRLTVIEKLLKIDNDTGKDTTHG